MRLVVQRVSRASVRVDGEPIGSIRVGALVLAGIGADDTREIVEAMAAKLVALRYFRDAEGRTNLDLAAVGGSLLVVSQFTLYADLRRGRRPGFSGAAEPVAAERLVEGFISARRGLGAPVETGRFGAEMSVELVNDGPFTMVLDSASDPVAGATALA